jgi:hypothetical protein
VAAESGGVDAVEARDERKTRAPTQRQDLVARVAEVGVQDARSVARQGGARAARVEASLRVLARQARAQPTQPLPERSRRLEDQDRAVEGEAVGIRPLAAHQQRASRPAAGDEAMEEGLRGLEPGAPEVRHPDAIAGRRHHDALSDGAASP